MIYDELDRKIAATDSLGNTRRYAYDSRNHEVRRVDPLGNVIRSEYDTYGRRVAEIVEQTDSGVGGGTALSPATTRSEYDANGNLVTLVDPLGRSTRHTFDALDRRREVIYPDGSRFRFEYDADGNLVQVEDANGARQGPDGRRHGTNDSCRVRQNRLDARPTPGGHGRSHSGRVRRARTPTSRGERLRPLRGPPRLTRPPNRGVDEPGSAWNGACRGRSC